MTPEPIDSTPVSQKVFQALSEYLRRDPGSFQAEDSLRDDLGLDSLMTIELLYEIESVFDLQIPDEDFGGLVTIGNVIEYIEKKTKPSSPRRAGKSSSSKAKTKTPTPASKSSSHARKRR